MNIDPMTIATIIKRAVLQTEDLVIKGEVSDREYEVCNNFVDRLVVKFIDALNLYGEEKKQFISWSISSHRGGKKYEDMIIDRYTKE